MSISFLRSTDPALSNAITQSMHVGAQLGTEASKAQAEQALMLQRSQMERQMQIGLKKYEVENENMRARNNLIEKAVANVSGAVSSRIKSNYDYLKSDGTKLDPASRQSIATQIRTDEATLGNLHQQLGIQTSGISLPNTGTNMEDPYSITNYSPDEQARIKAEALKPQLEASNLLLSNQANQIASYTSGGVFATPQESLHSQQITQTGKYQQQRIGLSEERLNLKSGLGGPVGVNGKPITDPSELYHLEHSQSILPEAKPQINDAINSWREAKKNGDVNADKKLQSSIAPYQDAYGQVSDFYYNNADDKIKSTIAKLGLGLKPNTLIGDNNILSKAISDPNNTAEQQGIIGHIYSGLGFGKMQGVPEYKPTPRYRPSFNSFLPNGQSSPTGDNNSMDDVSNIGILSQ